MSDDRPTPEEVMTRMNSKTQSFDAMAPGGISTMTPMDLAAAMGMGKLSRAAELVGYAKHTDDMVSSAALIDLLADRLFDRVPRSGLSVDQRLLLAQLVMYESLSNRKCQRCRGAGVMKSQKDCIACGGTGQGKPASERVCAEFLGITRHAWRTGGERYRVMMRSWLAEAEMELNTHLVERFMRG